MYAHYLCSIDEPKRAEHPAFEAVMRSQPTDAATVTANLIGTIPGDRSVWYQKHMAHHLTPKMDWGWIAQLTNCFLIRDPAAMITSFIKVIENPTPDDLGLPQQVKLFERVKEQTGTIPAVLDSKDVLSDPPGTLTKLCAHCRVPFDEAMLEWAPGPKAEDGVWAPHWYASVNRSTGFAPYVEKDERVPDRLLGVLEECNALYEILAQHRMRMD